jgi:hypothetical protein
MALATTAVPALQAAGFVGIWNTDVPAGRSVLDAGAATLLAGNASLAGHPLPLDVALGQIHPEDRRWVFGKIGRVRQTGGPVSLEFRVLTVTGEIRWILNRGCLAVDATGVLQGRGAYIDVTDLYDRPAQSPAGAKPEHLEGSSRPLHPGPRRPGARRRQLSADDLRHAAARDRPRAGAARSLKDRTARRGYAPPAHDVLLNGRSGAGA